MPSAMSATTGTNMRTASKLSPALRLMPPSPVRKVKNSATKKAIRADGRKTSYPGNPSRLRETAYLSRFDALDSGPAMMQSFKNG